MCQLLNTPKKITSESMKNVSNFLRIAFKVIFLDVKWYLLKVSVSFVVMRI